MIALQNSPGMDMERSAVLGAMVIEGFMTGSSIDALHMYGMSSDNRAKDKAVPLKTYEDIRNLEYGSTYFDDPLRASIDKLKSSKKKNKVLILFTDGFPNGESRKEELPYLHKQYKPPQNKYSTFAVGLHNGNQVQGQKRFLEGLMVRPKEDLKMTSDPTKLVPLFIEGFARAIGSKPEVGQVSKDKKVHVPKYVTQIFVVLTSHDPGPPFDVDVRSNNTLFSPTRTGNNGCAAGYRLLNAPNLCDDPRRHFVTYRIPHDPLKETTFDIQVKSNQNLDYGVIYRYDLDAEITTQNCKVEVGNQQKITAHINFANKIFDDEDFFSKDNFQAFFETNGQSVPLTRKGGIFEGNWSPVNQGSQTGRVVFKNDWMEIQDTIDCTVTGTLDLNIVVSPLDLGDWDGDGIAVTKCGLLDAGASSYLDLVETECTLADVPSRFKATCEPIMDNVSAGNQPTSWEVCLTSPSCCEESFGPLAVQLTPKNTRYANRAAQTNVSFTVRGTSFWNCWKYWIIGGITTLLLLLLVYGYTSPHNFDDPLYISFGDSLRDMKRSDSFMCSEQPKGKKGFFRNARVSIKDFDFVGDHRMANLSVMAGPNGKLVILSGNISRFDSRRRTWKELTEEEIQLGLSADEVYRSGDELYFTFSY